MADTQFSSDKLLHPREGSRKLGEAASTTATVLDLDCILTILIFALSL